MKLFSEEAEVFTYIKQYKSVLFLIPSFSYTKCTVTKDRHLPSNTNNFTAAKIHPADRSKTAPLLCRHMMIQ